VTSAAPALSPLEPLSNVLSDMSLFSWETIMSKALQSMRPSSVCHVTAKLPGSSVFCPVPSVTVTVQAPGGSVAAMSRRHFTKLAFDVRPVARTVRPP